MKRITKYWFDFFVYFSLLFLVIVLIKSDYLIIPKLLSIKCLMLSFASLFFGFIMNAIAWKQILDGSKNPVKLKHSISSSGMAVFGKYIPGKVWAMVGQAGYIINKYNYAKSDLAALILSAQFISIWIGLMLSSAALVLLGSFNNTNTWIVFMLLALLSLLIFTSISGKLGNWIFSRIIKRKAVVLNIDFKTKLKTSFMYLLNWVFWCAGFYLLVVSLTGRIEFPVRIGLSFALALTAGFLALIVPGGLGVREGVLITCLTALGFDIHVATTVSIASRLWFLIGECFIFGLGFIIDKSSK